MSQPERIKLFKNPAVLDEYFLLKVTSKVKHDATLSLDNILFETEQKLADSRVEVRYDPTWLSNPNTPILLYHEGKKINEARQVNFYDNAHVKRKKPGRPERKHNESSINPTKKSVEFNFINKEGEILKQKILIIDDDIELCALAKKYLETEGYVVTTKHNGADGLTEGLTTSYHLVVLDVMLPQKNGFDVLVNLRKTRSVPVLMLTAKDSEIDKVSGLRLGADDYLTKPFSMNEFVARVQSIIRRYTALGGESEAVSVSMLTFDNLSITPAAREVVAFEATVELTAKEFDLLYFLAKNNGRVFTKKQIYSAVWKDEYAFDDNNIMVHIRRLRKKIEINPEQPQFIKTVWGVGYKFDGRNSI